MLSTISNCGNCSFNLEKFPIHIHYHNSHQLKKKSTSPEHSEGSRDHIRCKKILATAICSKKSWSPPGR